MMAVKVKQESFQSTNRIIYSHKGPIYNRYTKALHDDTFVQLENLGNREKDWKQWRGGMGGGWGGSQLSKCAIEQSLLNNPDQAQ